MAHVKREDGNIENKFFDIAVDTEASILAAKTKAEKYVENSRKAAENKKNSAKAICDAPKKKKVNTKVKKEVKVKKEKKISSTKR